MNSILEYAKLLDNAGTQIVEISNSLKNGAEVTSSENIEDLMRKSELLKNGLIQFVEVRNVAATFPAPESLQTEHRELIDSLDEFLKGTTEQLESIDVINATVDEEKYQDGIAKQQRAENRTSDVLNRIVNKFK